MPFNLATFKTRATTAAIFVIIVLTGLLWNYWSFLLLFTIIHFGCWWEYLKLVGLIDKDYQNISPFHKYGIMLLGWGLMLCFTNGAYSFLDIRLKDIGIILSITMVPVIIYADMVLIKPINFKLFAHSFFGLIYISLSWGLMMHLRCFDMIRKGNNIYVDFFGYTLPLMIIISIWINDTMAYIVGSFIGKTPFSKISPKKTWEGTIGGVILCIVVMATLWYLFQYRKIIDWIVIAAIAAIFGTLGDLLESKLKRLAGVKDSGSLMPGHGGFLDRFDSLLFATPFVWLYAYFFMR
ncbi:MAG TPA: phosphatidate cytidylyltransferase [Chitinophagaceae bacterium]|nr:phosphatidate cytidylyltransferase [Chitinophagaceae bacterium]